MCRKGGGTFVCVGGGGGYVTSHGDAEDFTVPFKARDAAFEDAYGMLVDIIEFHFFMYEFCCVCNLLLCRMVLLDVFGKTAFSGHDSLRFIFPSMITPQMIVPTTLS